MEHTEFIGTVKYTFFHLYYFILLFIESGEIKYLRACSRFIYEIRNEMQLLKLFHTKIQRTNISVSKFFPNNSCFHYYQNTYGPKLPRNCHLFAKFVLVKKI